MIACERFSVDEYIKVVYIHCLASLILTIESYTIDSAICLHGHESVKYDYKQIT